MTGGTGNRVRGPREKTGAKEAEPATGREQTRRWAYRGAQARRAISHGEQRSTTVTEKHQSLQLSGPDSCAPYTFQAGYAGSIPVARSKKLESLAIFDQMFV